MSHRAMSLTCRVTPIALLVTGLSLIVLNEAPGMGGHYLSLL